MFGVLHEERSRRDSKQPAVQNARAFSSAVKTRPPEPIRPNRIITAGKGIGMPASARDRTRRLRLMWEVS